MKNNIVQTVKRTVSQIIEAIKDEAIMPEVEISDMETLKHYRGKRLKLFDPKSGYEGRAIYGKLTRCSKEVGVFVADEGNVTVHINDGSFQKGILLFPAREK